MLTSRAVRLTVIAAPLAALVLAACGGSSPAHSRAVTTPATSQGSSATGCRTVAVPAPKGPQHLSAPTARLDPAKPYTITITTNCGTFAVRLDVRHWPKTAASVYALAKRGFYTGLTVHRVAANFVIQGGDPLGDGSGGPGYTVVEPPPAGTHYSLGEMAMAKTQTDPSGASGSQFFIFTSAAGAAGLPPQYAGVGQVVSGLNVVQRIGALPTNPPGDGSPTPAVVMTAVSVSAG